MKPLLRTYRMRSLLPSGGTCGCIIAGRLAAADSSISILVLEAGPPTGNNPLHVQPARYLYHLRPESTTVRFHVGKESAALAGRAPIIPVGQCVGGGSSVNFAMYTRAAASDYDDWAKVYGNKGWSTRDLLPLLRKCESYQLEQGQPTHGYSGPLKVSHGGFSTQFGKEFLDVAAQYDKTRTKTDDVNGLFECDKYGYRSSRELRWIDAETGKRSDIPHHYIYNRELPNLHIVPDHHVKKVLFEGKRAVGVQYVASTRSATDAKGEVRTAMARRMIIISAGAFGSPALLERSGIGSKDVLDRVGVEQVIELPGVGENYQDHQVIFPSYLTTEAADTLDGIVTNNEAEIAKWTKEWQETGKGLLAANGIDAGVKLRPNEVELTQIGDVFRRRWEDYYVPAPDKPVLWMGTLSLFPGDRSQIPVEKAFSIGWYIQHPVSVGYSHIISADDAEAPLDFHPGYLDAPEELALHMWGYKRSREFARRLPSYRGEVANHPKFAPTSKAAIGERSEPVPISAPDIDYSAEDDRALEAYIRQNVATTWHSMGTCAMKKREEGGVVDSRLNVYGVEGLKVTEVASDPHSFVQNTYSTAIVIGEKASTIIAEELGITLEDNYN
ncbi:alcohol oxidase-like protein [Trametes gibbosa]|nr:alcohol oxidase-like protein [Trametes gibbosa]